MTSNEVILVQIFKQFQQFNQFNGLKLKLVLKKIAGCNFILPFGLCFCVPSDFIQSFILVEKVVLKKAQTHSLSVLCIHVLNRHSQSSSFQKQN